MKPIICILDLCILICLVNAEDHIPYLAAGGGWESEVRIYNRGKNQLALDAEVLDTGGMPLELMVHYQRKEPQSMSEFSFTLAPNGMTLRKFTSVDNLRVGSLRLKGETSDLSATLIYRCWDEDRLITAAGVLPIRQKEFTIPYAVVERQDAGIAILNPNSETISVHVVGYSPDGVRQDLSRTDIAKIQPNQLVTQMISGVLAGQYKSVLTHGRVQLTSEEPFYLVVLATQTDKEGNVLISTLAVE